MFRRTWKTQMTASERSRGLVFFALYLLVFPHLNAWAQRVISGEGEPLVAEANVLYYALLFTLSLLLFWSFLKRDFQELLNWLPENLVAVAVCLLLAGGLHAVLTLLPFPVHLVQKEHLVPVGEDLHNLVSVHPVTSANGTARCRTPPPGRW